jgi:hypothetical protein
LSLGGPEIPGVVPDARGFSTPDRSGADVSQTSQTSREGTARAWEWLTSPFSPPAPPAAQEEAPLSLGGPEIPNAPDAPDARGFSTPDRSGADVPQTSREGTARAESGALNPELPSAQAGARELPDEWNETPEFFDERPQGFVARVQEFAREGFNTTRETYGVIKAGIESVVFGKKNPVVPVGKISDPNIIRKILGSTSGSGAEEGAPPIESGSGIGPQSLGSAKIEALIQETVGTKGMVKKLASGATGPVIGENPAFQLNRQDAPPLNPGFGFQAERPTAPAQFDVPDTQSPTAAQLRIQAQQEGLEEGVAIRDRLADVYGERNEMNQRVEDSLAGQDPGLLTRAANAFKSASEQAVKNAQERVWEIGSGIRKLFSPTQTPQSTLRDPFADFDEQNVGYDGQTQFTDYADDNYTPPAQYGFDGAPQSGASTPPPISGGSFRTSQEVGLDPSVRSAQDFGVGGEILGIGEVSGSYRTGVETSPERASARAGAQNLPDEWNETPVYFDGQSQVSGGTKTPDAEQAPSAPPSVDGVRFGPTGAETPSPDDSAGQPQAGGQQPPSQPQAGAEEETRPAFNRYGREINGAGEKVSDVAQNACDSIGGTCTFTSGYRSKEHNESVGGASGSRHIQGDALDVVVPQEKALAFVRALRGGLCATNNCNGGIGYYGCKGTTCTFHIDTRPNKSAWGPDYSSGSIIGDAIGREQRAFLNGESSSVQYAGAPMGRGLTGVPLIDRLFPQQGQQDPYYGSEGQGQSVLGGLLSRLMGGGQSGEEGEALSGASGLDGSRVSGGQQPGATQPPPQSQPPQTSPQQQPVLREPRVSCEPDAIAAGVTGEVNIRWTCFDSTSSRAVGFGNGAVQPASGEAQIRVNATSTEDVLRFGVQCSNGTQRTCTIPILRASVALTPYPEVVSSDEAGRLTWASTGTSACTVYAPGGIVIARGEKVGSIQTPQLTRSTEFRVVCRGESGAVATDVAEVRVEGDTDASIQADPVNDVLQDTAINPAVSEVSGENDGVGVQASDSSPSGTGSTAIETTTGNQVTTCDPNIGILRFTWCLAKSPFQ